MPAGAGAPAAHILADTPLCRKRRSGRRMMERRPNEQDSRAAAAVAGSGRARATGDEENVAVDVETAIRERRSVRKFRLDPVPPELIREVLDTARWSPSWANTQCWSIFVVAGEVLERLKAASREKARRGEASTPDLPMPLSQWPEYLRQRTARLQQRQPPELAADGSEADTKATFASALGELFGAPCLLLFAVDRRLVPEYACFDTGLIAQSVCLAAHEKGLGTVITAMAVRDPSLLRAMLPGAADKLFVIGVALGYPDWDAAVNRVARERAGLDELVTWVA